MSCCHARQVAVIENASSQHGADSGNTFSQSGSGENSQSVATGYVG